MITKRGAEPPHIFDWGGGGAPPPPPPAPRFLRYIGGPHNLVCPGAPTSLNPALNPLIILYNCI